MAQEVSEEFRLNFTDVEGVKEQEPVPASLQYCEITDAEVVPAGPGAKYPGEPVISLEFTILDGDYESRKVWDRIAVGESTLYDDDGEPKFNFKKLKSLLAACDYDVSGELQFSVVNLIGERLDIRIGVKPPQGEYSAKNVVKNYYPHEMSEKDMLQ